MDTQKYSTLFNNYLVKLLAVLKENLPQHKNIIAKCYQKYRKADRDTYIEYTMNKLSPHTKYIISQDPFLFSPEYSPEPLRLLSGLDFKVIWVDLDESVCDTVWSYMQNLYITGSYALNIGPKDKSCRIMLQNIQNERELQQDDDDDDDEENQENDSFGFDMGSFPDLSQLNMDDIIDENNPFYKLMKGIGGDLEKEVYQTLGIDPNNKNSNPADLLSSLFTQNPEKIEGLAEHFGKKLMAKAKEENITEKDLLSGISDMFTKLMSHMGGEGGIEGMPDFSIFKDIDPEKMHGMSDEEKSEYLKELMAKMTNSMSPESIEKMNQLTNSFGGGDAGGEGSASGEDIFSRLADPKFFKNFNLGKVQHILSLGGEKVEEVEEDTIDNETREIIFNKGSLKMDNQTFYYIDCGETLMKISEEPWEEFLSSKTTNHMSEVMKFVADAKEKND